MHLNRELKTPWTVLLAPVPRGKGQKLYLRDCSDMSHFATRKNRALMGDI